MLDLTKLAQQMQGISQHLTQEAAATRLRLDRSQTLLDKAYRHQNELVILQEQWRDRITFTAATPIEPLNLRVSIPTAPSAHTVIATDGSQIAPSHHEIAYCYLINIGRIVLHYGQSRHPLLDSLPEVFYRPEDLYLSRQWGIRTEEWMGYRRTVSEAIAIAELGQHVQESSELRSRSISVALASNGVGVMKNEELETPNSPFNETRQMNISGIQATPLVTPPTLAMVDGSLIYWFLEQLPTEARNTILQPILAAWEQLRQAKVPLVGYLSASRSGEAVNFLRLPACPFDVPDCMTHCSGKNDVGQKDHAPCQVLEPLKDPAMWAMQLQPGQRSPIWRSSASILDLYGDLHRVYFCYVHVGTEVARVEFPGWVLDDRTLLDDALSLVLAQVQKGYGYPVALAEAHNQAVVRGGDRTRFFALLEQQMIRAGLQNVGVSYKEARKRGSIA
ncbi:DNA double-strand break repair nuclease NurA [Phormidium sp. CLA17]|uniref:DNA double-strand break repair nuclease NurA n=1 Tax=Leptolyngbya sp. Cla-17 TaxID=2803751 RepID=UPI0014920A49|nr:DNA double-strand break repair nuclease NurA [Leptolyngbya sp. Cla-17]MBM0741654.1 DNA double-strand break repair nuclease NurA [Leptolyngbya sp. Cla-17]